MMTVVRPHAHDVVQLLRPRCVIGGEGTHKSFVLHNSSTRRMRLILGVLFDIMSTTLLLLSVLFSSLLRDLRPLMHRLNRVATVSPKSAVVQPVV